MDGGIEQEFTLGSCLDYLGGENTKSPFFPIQAYPLLCGINA